MDERVRETLRGDALAEAATAVERAESGDGTVTWGDVSDAVPAEQWGRLLESELLVATQSGFVAVVVDRDRPGIAERPVGTPEP